MYKLEVDNNLSSGLLFKNYKATEILSKVEETFITLERTEAVVIRLLQNLSTYYPTVWDRSNICTLDTNPNNFLENLSKFAKAAVDDAQIQKNRNLIIQNNQTNNKNYNNNNNNNYNNKFNTSKNNKKSYINNMKYRVEQLSNELKNNGLSIPPFNNNNLKD